MPVEVDDLEAIQKSINEAAGHVRTLWITFLTLAAYLAIAAGSVTHRMIFEETPIKLPILNVELPLVGFFFVAPLLFFVFHFYMFVQILMLTHKVEHYNEVLKSKFPDPNKQELIVRRLDQFPLLQAIAGPPEILSHSKILVLKLIGVTSMTLLPILILLQIQLTFLPYHGWVTMWHRVLFVIDLAAIGSFWTLANPLRGSGKCKILRWLRQHFAVLALAVVSALFSIVIATYPGEFLDRNWISAARIIPRSSTEDGSSAVKWTSIYELMFLGSVNEITGKRNSLWSNTLVLPDQRFVDEENLEKKNFSVSLRGRDLRGAVLIRADLRLADFTGANLIGARLDGADMSGGLFACSETGIRLDAEGRAIVARTKAIGWPDNGCTWLQGATLKDAILVAANFNGARLDGAVFDSSELVGASFIEASLQASSFNFAKLQGASLGGAVFHGASLKYASLQGVSFGRTDFLSVFSTPARFDGALIEGGRLFRSEGPLPSLRFAHLKNLTFTEAPGDSEFDKWLTQRLKHLPPRLRESLSERLTRLKPPEPSVQPDKKSSPLEAGPEMAEEGQFGGKLFPGEFTTLLLPSGILNIFKSASRADPKAWNAAIKESEAEMQDEDNMAAFAEFLRALACKSDGAPYIARGLIKNDRFSGLGSRLPTVVERLKRQSECPAAAELTPRDMQDLDSLLARHRSANRP